MIQTKNEMAQMLMNDFTESDLELKNIKQINTYNVRDTDGIYSNLWFSGKNYNFYEYWEDNATYPYIYVYDKQGNEVFNQSLNYSIRKLYIDENGYFYGITTSTRNTTDYKLTLFNRIEEENTIYKRKSYTLKTDNLTSYPDVTKKDDSNYFIHTIEANVGGYRTMLVWQLTIDVKNGNQFKYWQNEFDHGKDDAEIEYSFDFSVGDLAIVRFCFAENTTSNSVKTIAISKTNLLLSDEDFNDEGTQKKAKLLQENEYIDTFSYYMNSGDWEPRRYICMTENNLFATLHISRPTSEDNPVYTMKYWIEDEESLVPIEYTLDIDETFLPAVAWEIKDKLLIVCVPTKVGSPLQGQEKSCKTYIYMLKFDNNYNATLQKEVFSPTFHLCKSTDGSSYYEHDYNITSYLWWLNYFNLLNVVKTQERWYANIRISAWCRETAESDAERKNLNLSFIIDNVYEMKKSKFCNVPEFMQVNNNESLLAKMQTQYYESSDLVSVFNVPNDSENGDITSLNFYDKYDQLFCNHDVDIDKNVYENVYINHITKYRVLNDGKENKEASKKACELLTVADGGITRWLPYIRLYRIIMEDGTETERNIDNHYTINNNVITFTIPHAEGRGKIQLLGNIATSTRYAPIYYTKEFTRGTSTTITCTIN